MKSNLMNFIILVYVLYLVRLYLGLKVPPNNYKRSFNELLQCRICMDLFSYDFNYDEYLKNKATLAQIKESLIASKLAFQGKDEEVSKNKIEVISREISMKYFFKGSDYNEDTNKIKKCIAKSKERINNSIKNDNYDKECEIVLSKACEFILSYEKNKCSVPFLSLSSSSDVNNNDNSFKINDADKLSNNFKSDSGSVISKEINDNKEDSVSSLKVSSTGNNDSNNNQISNLIQLLGNKSNNSNCNNENNKNNIKSNLNTLISLINTNKENKSNENNENSENNTLIKDLIAKLSGQQNIKNHNNIKNNELENSITLGQNSFNDNNNSNNNLHANSYISRINNINNTDKLDNIYNINNLNSTIDPQYKKLEDLSKLLNLESNKYVNSDNSSNSNILNKLKFKKNDNTPRKASMSFINRNNNKSNNNKQIYLNKNKSANNLKQIQSLLTPEVLSALGLKQANNRNSITHQNYNSDNGNVHSLNNMQHSSLLELSLTPESIANNYTPTSPSDILKQDGNKSWSAPKPVIFDNFQDSLGGQLKDISYLTK